MGGHDIDDDPPKVPERFAYDVLEEFEISNKYDPAVNKYEDEILAQITANPELFMKFTNKEPLEGLRIRLEVPTVLVHRNGMKFDGIQLVKAVYKYLQINNLTYGFKLEKDYKRKPCVNLLERYKGVKYYHN